MGVQVRSVQLKTTLRQLKSFKQQVETYKIAGQIDSEIHNPFGQKFVVDRWPRFDTILGVIPTANSIKYPRCFTFATRCADQEKLISFIKESLHPSDEKGELLCEGVPKRLQGAMVELGKRWGRPYEHEWDNFILTVDPNDIKLFPLPEWYASESLTPDDAEFITGNWDYITKEDLTEMVKYNIATRPSLGVRDKNGHLVAWAFTHFWASAGALYIFPEHRRKGLGQYISSAILAQQGTPLFAHVVSSNPAGLKMDHKIGLKIARGHDDIWGYF